MDYYKDNDRRKDKRKIYKGQQYNPISSEKLIKEQDRVNRILKKKFPQSEEVKISKKLIRASKAFRKDLIKKETLSETRTKNILEFLNIKYQFQKIFFYKEYRYIKINTKYDKRRKRKYNYNFYIVDFYLPEYNIVIEIDGGYHSTKSQRKKDFKRSKILEDLGVERIIRFKNENILYEKDYVINVLNKLLV